MRSVIYLAALLLSAGLCRADDELRALTARLEAQNAKPANPGGIVIAPGPGQLPAGPRDGDCCKAADGGADWTYDAKTGTWWRYAAPVSPPATFSPPTYFAPRYARPFGFGAANCGPRGG